MTTTPRSVRDDVKNILDYLSDAELALFTNEVSLVGARVSFHRYDSRAAFLISHEHPTLEQYMNWTAAGDYSAVLLDGSLLQVTYDVSGGRVSGHRLAYIPCPYDLDRELLAAGYPIADVLELHRDDTPALRSPVRFDFDPERAKKNHSAAHLTINGIDCRIA